jgi:hypothetical protein
MSAERLRTLFVLTDVISLCGRTEESLRSVLQRSSDDGDEEGHSEASRRRRRQLLSDEATALRNVWMEHRASMVTASCGELNLAQVAWALVCASSFALGRAPRPETVASAFAGLAASLGDDSVRGSILRSEDVLGPGTLRSVLLYLSSHWRRFGRPCLGDLTSLVESLDGWLGLAMLGRQDGEEERGSAAMTGRAFADAEPRVWSMRRSLRVVSELDSRAEIGTTRPPTINGARRLLLLSSVRSAAQGPASAHYREIFMPFHVGNSVGVCDRVMLEAGGADRDVWTGCSNQDVVRCRRAEVYHNTFRETSTESCIAFLDRGGPASDELALLLLSQMVFGEDNIDLLEEGFFVAEHDLETEWPGLASGPPKIAREFGAYYVIYEGGIERHDSWIDAALSWLDACSRDGVRARLQNTIARYVDGDDVPRPSLSSGFGTGD